MAWKGKQVGVARLALVWMLAFATGCGGENAVVGPDPSVSPLVGDWKATVMVLESVANPDIAPDLIQLGAAFTLNIQPSGQYTAILIFAEQASTEIGVIAVSGNVMTMTRSFPSPGTVTAIYVLAGSHLTLDGDSTFDFNLDGTPEPALAHVELERQ